MPDEAAFSQATLLTFLLVLARVSGAVALVPFPGLRNGPEMARVVFAILLTWCLRPAWPTLTGEFPGFATLTMWILAETALGMTLGLFVAFLIESFQVGAQILGIQAGYSYASTIDPTTQADSGIISVMVQMMAGLCFFIAGVDHHLLRSLAQTFERFPPGQYAANLKTVALVTRAGAEMFATGLRIALPVIAFLLLVDLALALLGRIQTQLQLLSLAFPAKMLVTLVLLGSAAALFPTLFQSAARHTLDGIARVMGG